MRKNRNLNIIGSKVVLVPYKVIHVPKYHKWMQSQELQELTASDPLTEEEEYKMQRSWLEDEDSKLPKKVTVTEKCTFIILDKQVMQESGDEIKAMIGDTNLYLVRNLNDILTAETGIMIAEELVRRRRMGMEAMMLMLRYGIEELNVLKYIAKIGMTNIKSIQMFEKLGFDIESKSDVFQEITLEKNVTEVWKAWLCEQTLNRQTQIFETDS